MDCVSDLVKNLDLFCDTWDFIPASALFFIILSLFPVKERQIAAQKCVWKVRVIKYLTAYLCLHCAPFFFCLFGLIGKSSLVLEGHSFLGNIFLLIWFCILNKVCRYAEKQAFHRYLNIWNLNFFGQPFTQNMQMLSAAREVGQNHPFSGAWIADPSLFFLHSQITGFTLRWTLGI